MLLKTFASHVLPFRHKPFFHLSPSIPGFAALSVALFLVCLFASQWKSVLLTGIVFPTYFSWKCLNIDDIKEVLNLFCDHANKQKVSWSLLAAAYPHLRRDTDAACSPKGGKQLCSFASPRVPTSIDRHSFTEPSAPGTHLTGGEKAKEVWAFQVIYLGKSITIPANTVLISNFLSIRLIGLLEVCGMGQQGISLSLLLPWHLACLSPSHGPDLFLQVNRVAETVTQVVPRSKCPLV